MDENYEKNKSFLPNVVSVKYFVTVTQKLLMHPGDDFFFLIVKKK
jgi:hypothetical protein